MTKSEIRQRVRGDLATLTPEQRATHSAAIIDRLLQQPGWRDASTLLLFAPLPDEPDISPLLHHALSAGRGVHLPRYDADAGLYSACRITHPADLSPGKFGVLEPLGHCSVQPLNHLDFILVPGVAFDFTGCRVGRGKGFYDRLLARVQGHKCGVGFDLQLFDQLPTEPHDVRLDSILTPTRWHMCQGAV